MRQHVYNAVSISYVVSLAAQPSMAVRHTKFVFFFLIYCHCVMPRFKHCVVKDERYVLYFEGIDCATLGTKFG